MTNPNYLQLSARLRILFSQLLFGIKWAFSLSRLSFNSPSLSALQTLFHKEHFKLITRRIKVLSFSMPLLLSAGVQTVPHPPPSLQVFGTPYVLDFASYLKDSRIILWILSVAS